MKKIKSITVKKSKFFEQDFKIVFSEKLNCIMGGRGTGKTTLLYLIKTSIYPDSENEKIPYSILRSNLEDGEVTVEYEIDESSSIIITKFFGEKPQFVKLPEEKIVPYSKVKNYIETDIYEASIIEEIGRNGLSRLSLIDTMIKETLNLKNTEIENNIIDLDENAQELISLNSKVCNSVEKLESFRHIKDEMDEHKTSQPKDIDDQEDKKFRQEDLNEKKRNKEVMLINKINKEFSLIKDNISELLSEVNEFTESNFEDITAYLNSDIIREYLNNFNKIKDSLTKKSKEILIEIEDSFKLNKKNRTDLERLHFEQESNFAKLRQKIQKNKEYYKKLNELSKQNQERENINKELKELEEKRKKLQTKRKILLDNFNLLKKELFNERLINVNNLNKLFNKKIKINLTYGGLTENYENLLRDALKGSGLRYNELIPRIINNFSPDELAIAIMDKDYNKFKSVTGIDEVRSKAIIEALFGKESLYKIESTYCPDLPDFYLRIENENGDKIKKENYSKSDELSTGQRCTTVLPIVFAVSKNPLIIDQPEDNLDNKYITNEIFKIIQNLKLERQLIFITHNPNIPVLPDAEQNIFLKYDKKASVDIEGTVLDVKNNILDLLEGGKMAFDIRKKMYDNGD